MQVPIEAPLEIKKKIARRLQKSGALKKIERKIKLGMMVAVEEIKSDPKEPTHLERHRFKDASINEIKALQCIYAYLAENNMTYTLSTLLEESCVERQTSSNYDLLEVLEDVNQEYEEDEIPYNKKQYKTKKQDDDYDSYDNFDL